MPQLDRIKIKGFKSIKDSDVKLSSLNILIGPNGAGKSNFISFFKMLNEIVNARFQNYVTKYGGSNALLYFGQKHTDSIDAYLEFGKNAYEFVLEPTINNQMFFAKEYISYHNQSDPKPWEDYHGTGHKETSLIRASKNEQGQDYSIANKVLDSLKSWRVYHFHDTSESSKIKGNCDINDNWILRPDASNLAAFLYLLKLNHFEYYSNILKTVQLIAPFIEDFILEPAKLNSDIIRLEWKHKESDDYFDISQLSDGTIRTICIATLLLQPDLPSCILIDEPELGLHPYAINIIGSLFKSVSMKTQIIASTQSLLLVDQLEPEDLIVVDYKNDQSVLKRPTSEELQDWLEVYSLGELWEKNVLGGRP